MHSPSLSFECHGGDKSEEEVLLNVTSLVTEGRIPEKLGPKSKGFREGPHCFLGKKAEVHICDASDSLCVNYDFFREEVLRLWVQNLPITLEVILTCGCPEGEYSVGPEVGDNCVLLESWNFSIVSRHNSVPPSFQLAQLLGAIRSQLYFSQITAWLTTPNESTKKRLTSKHLRYRIAQPGLGSKATKFLMNPVEHNFPMVQVGHDSVLKVSFWSMPRMASFPNVQCQACSKASQQESIMEGVKEATTKEKLKKLMLGQRIPYGLSGKHNIDDNDRTEKKKQADVLAMYKRLRYNAWDDQPSASTINHINSARQLNNEPKSTITDHTKPGRTSQDISKERKSFDHFDTNDQCLLEAIERVGLRTPEKTRKPPEKAEGRTTEREEDPSIFCNINKSLKVNANFKRTCSKSRSCDNKDCDRCGSDRFSKNRSCSDGFEVRRAALTRRLAFEEDENRKGRDVPSTSDQTRFKRILNSSASMVFHKTGLPLMSSPAPARKGKTCFDFDASIGSATDIKSAFFSSSFSTDEESESDGSQMSPCSPETYLAQKDIEEEKEPRAHARWRPRRRKGQPSNLLGSFEESVLNGRLEPVSTVQGFSAELGASGSFVPEHLKVPVTVFFYTVGDHERMSSPYLCHIKLEKKGYCVPKVGTFQVTLKNPLGMVVKMFVVLYDLSDMPPNSKTFLRQRILFLPTDCKDENVWRTSKWLKYLIHLRFASSKSGKIYLHGDIRIIVLNKADLDTASAHDTDTKYEMRTITLMPANPRFSHRK